MYDFMKEIEANEPSTFSDEIEAIYNSTEYDRDDEYDSDDEWEG